MEERVRRIEGEVSELWQALDALKQGQSKIASTLEKMSSDLGHLLESVVVMRDQGTFRCVEHEGKLRELEQHIARNREEAVGYIKRVEVLVEKQKTIVEANQKLGWKTVGIAIGASTVFSVLVSGVSIAWTLSRMAS